jgi:hypothetical protein
MTRNIAAKRASATLAWVWFSGFCLCLSIPSFLVARHGIMWDEFSASLGTISGLYVPYLGIILSYYFATSRINKLRHVDGTPFTIAVAASVVWNLVILGIYCSILSGNLGIEDARTISPQAGSALSWLVAPLIGFFYGNPAPSKERD